ncbi:MAG: LLM class flavin-dependent oxidoreductase [Acidimicrobiales bacterium]|nr:LLM class flavin-dependent oxidoreductase [Acidimicrobiales bacterium]
MTGSASFSLFLPQIHMTPDAIEHRVRTAEEFGFDGVALMDHLVPPGRPDGECYEGFVLASFLAARTQRLQISHLVVCSEFRPPALLAKMATTLDHVSGGRFELGVGWGSWPEEFAQFGLPDYPPAVRAARLAESLDIIERLWSGERFDHAGTHFTLREALQLPAPLNGRIPILIGGSGKRYTLPLVRRFADWWNCPSYAMDRLDELVPLAGSARVSAQHPIGLVAHSGERDAVTDEALRRYGNWGGLIVGTSDEVIAALVQEKEAGVERFFVLFTDFAQPDTIRRFATEVIPAVAQA